MINKPLSLNKIMSETTVELVSVCVNQQAVSKGKKIRLTNLKLPLTIVNKNASEYTLFDD